MSIKEVKPKVKSTSTESKSKQDEVYDRTDLHNHILSRPDSYIGSVSPVKEFLYIPEEDENNKISMIYKQIEYVQGFYKIVDEVIVNARDQYVRLNTGLEENIDKEQE